MVAREGRETDVIRPKLASRTERELAKAAREQHGVLTACQLGALGLGPRAASHRVATGRLVRVHQGIYAVGRPTPEGLWMAAVMACGPGALLSHRSAAALWDVAADGPRVDVTIPSRAGRSHPGITIHRSETLIAADMTSRHGIPCTTLALTLVDLAAVVQPRTLERAIDRAETLRLFDLDAVEMALARHRGRRGTRALAAALADYVEPTITRSAAEERLLALIDSAGIRRPRLNAWIPLDGGTAYSPDLLWPEARLVVEIDGRAHHARRRAFAHDRQRDRRLALAGFETRRYAASELTTHPDRVVAELRAFLARTTPQRTTGEKRTQYVRNSPIGASGGLDRGVG